MVTKTARLHTFFSIRVSAKLFVMKRVMMKGKIHRATITEANLDYVGSLTVDEDLLERADILPYEQVHVVNINNGERLVTYAIKGTRGWRDLPERRSRAQG